MMWSFCKVSFCKVKFLLPIVVGTLGLGLVSPAIASSQPSSNPSTEPVKLEPASMVVPTEEVVINNAVAEPVIPVEVPLSLRLSLKARTVTLYRGAEKIVSYPVAIGRRGWETPKGEFKVLDMQKNPVWEHPWTGKLVPPGPNNPLGDRWIAFWSDGKNLIGFHGTIDESLIGQAVSHGCVRMKNQDVRALFEKIQVGTQVIVEP
jgi:L,D-transpeptidase ErfK/SrfK